MSETIEKKKRTRKPKVITNDVVEAPKVEEKKEIKGEYHIKVKLNDKEFEFDTDDIRSAILSTKQEFLRTRVIITITKGGKTVERMLYLAQGKTLFINRFAMDAFIKNLML